MIMNKHHRMRLGKRKALQRRMNTYAYWYRIKHYDKTMDWVCTKPWQCYNNRSWQRSVKHLTNKEIRNQERMCILHTIKNHETEDDFITNGSKYKRVHDPWIYD